MNTRIFISGVIALAISLGQARAGDSPLPHENGPKGGTNRYCIMVAPPDGRADRGALEAQCTSEAVPISDDALREYQSVTPDEARNRCRRSVEAKNYHIPGTGSLAGKTVSTCEALYSRMSTDAGKIIEARAACVEKTNTLEAHPGCQQGTSEHRACLERLLALATAARECQVTLRDLEQKAAQGDRALLSRHVNTWVRFRIDSRRIREYFNAANAEAVP